MEEKLVLTPEQLFFLGTLMGARHIDYDYIAPMHEMGRNYQRTQRKCMDELSQQGIIRQRMSGETKVRPEPEALLKKVFFGQTETVLEVHTFAQTPEKQVYRFHWLEGAATQVQQLQQNLSLSPVTQEQMDALLTRLTRTKERPEPLTQMQQDKLTGVLIAKRATVGVGQATVVLFEQNGGLYTMDEAAVPQGLSGSQAKEILLSVLKGE